MEKDNNDTVILNDEINCDNNTITSPIEKESCQFLKCILKDNNKSSSCDYSVINRESSSSVNNVEFVLNGSSSSNDNNDIINFNDCLDNACACDHFERVYVNQIYAKLNEDDEWIITWDVDERNEKDFIALCYHGE